jgi:hypothetical protein
VRALCSSRSWPSSTPALVIDDLALAVQDVVVLEDVLADLEVLALDLALGALDRAGDQLASIGGVVVHRAEVMNRSTKPALNSRMRSSCNER